MRITLKDAKTGKLVEAEILEAKQSVIPSIHAGWRFNFSKHAKKRYSKTFVIVTKDSPNTVEGCLIFQMLRNEVPYMAFVEKAPHNKGKGAKFEWVAGCLIAFACWLSFTGEAENKGWLTFDVMEEREEQALKLMSVYSKEYGAIRFSDTTTMMIQPEDGQKLIDAYLKS